MIIRVGHSKDFDYRSNLYQPLKALELPPGVLLSLPHDGGQVVSGTLDFLKSGCQLFLAEVSLPATGLGMEIGYAHVLGIPVACIHRRGTKPAGSLRFATETIFEYEGASELKAVVMKLINSNLEGRGVDGKY